MLTLVFVFMNMPQAEAAPQTATFTGLRCCPVSFTDPTGIIFTSLFPDPRAHIHGFNDANSHVGAFTGPTQFTFTGGKFTPLTLDITRLSGIHILTSSSGATIRLSVGTLVFPSAGWTGITSITWTSFSSGGFGFGTVDNLVFDVTIKADVDVKPGSDPSSYPCIDVDKVIPVAVLSTVDFDATTIDADTVRFGASGNEAAEVHQKNGVAKRHVEDKNKDGLLDMVFHFRFGDTGFSCADIGPGENSVILGSKITGNVPGRDFEGSDFLRLVRQ